MTLQQRRLNWTATMLNVVIKDRDMRDRLATDLQSMRARLAALVAQGPGTVPKKIHRDLIKSARGDARDLAGHIRRFDADARSARQAQGGKGRRVRRGQPQRQGD